MEEANIECSNSVMKNLLSRRSVRHFTERQLSREILDAVLMAGCFAPSGRNLQTWRFTVLTDAGKIRELKELICQASAQEKLPPPYGFENPSALILLSNDMRNENGIQDCACAAENMMLAAWSFGVGSVWLNSLKNLCEAASIRSILGSYGIPQNHRVWTMVALGYPAEEPRALARKRDVVHYV